MNQPNLTFRHDLNHTASHILAYAVKTIYPTAKLGMGPSIDDGFYYDFDFANPLKIEDLAKIECEMERIIKQNLEITHFEKSRTEAAKILDSGAEPYKLELLADLPKGEKPSFYKMGEFADLCAGPHIDKTGRIKAFRLTKITGAYWRADAKNKMLTRIYGVAFEKKSQLEEYLAWQEEIKRRDHNKIGRELGLFTTVDIVGQGLIHFLPKGSKIMQTMQRFVEDEEERRGYSHVKTPLMAKRDMYQLSGHWKVYKDGMFVIGDERLDDEVFALRPMACPFHFFLYKHELRSYRDLPIRYAETGIMFRNENSGEMHGLTRMRQFTMSEGHIVCRPDQMESEAAAWLDMFSFFMSALGMSERITYRLSKWDPNDKNKYLGEPKVWDEAQSALRKILKSSGLKFVEADGEAAFYGPKIDIQAKNIYGKEDTIATLQLDLQSPERYDMEFINENGDRVRPIVFHRASVGAYERILALVIENCAGAFPVWLAPTQAVVMGISNKMDDYVGGVFEKLWASGLRVNKDIRGEKVGLKIREHTMKKVPYLLIAGEREAEANLVSVRTREGADLGAMTIEAFLNIVNDKIKKFK